MKVEVTEFEGQRKAAADSARELLAAAAAHMAAAEAAEARHMEQRRVELQQEASEAALFATAASNADEWEGWEEEEKEEEKGAGPRVKNIQNMQQQRDNMRELEQQHPQEEGGDFGEEGGDFGEEGGDFAAVHEEYEEEEEEEKEEEEEEEEQQHNLAEEVVDTTPPSSTDQASLGVSGGESTGAATPSDATSQRSSADSNRAEIASLFDQLCTAIVAMTDSSHLPEAGLGCDNKEGEKGGCEASCESRLAAIEGHMAAQQAAMTLHLQQLRNRLESLEEAQTCG
jgi:hypothetical protein